MRNCSTTVPVNAGETLPNGTLKQDERIALDRDIEYAFETEEPMSARPPAGDSE